MCDTREEASVCNSHCSLRDLVSRSTLREVIKDSMSNCPRSFSPVEALVNSSANVFSSTKEFRTVVVLVRVQQCL